MDYFLEQVLLHQAAVLPFHKSIAKDYVHIDLSKHNTTLWEKVDVNNPADMESYIADFCSKQNKHIAFGGYLEKRNLYDRSDYFNTSEKRAIHLGVDFWSVNFIDVVAIEHGVIHSFKNNLNFGDYGPTLILEHELEGKKWYSLYGHLSVASMTQWKVGKIVKRGDVIGQLGNMTENGNYAPHLHLQIIIDLEGNNGDYPGVSALHKLDWYKINCPNPLLFYPLL